jgi:hypothetical protein
LAFLGKEWAKFLSKKTNWPGNGGPIGLNIACCSTFSVPFIAWCLILPSQSHISTSTQRNTQQTPKQIHMGLAKVQDPPRPPTHSSKKKHLKPSPSIHSLHPTTQIPPPFTLTEFKKKSYTLTLMILVI